MTLAACLSNLELFSGHKLGLKQLTFFQAGLFQESGISDLLFQIFLYCFTTLQKPGESILEKYDSVRNSRKGHIKNVIVNYEKQHFFW